MNVRETNNAKLEISVRNKPNYSPHLAQTHRHNHQPSRRAILMEGCSKGAAGLGLGYTRRWCGSGSSRGGGNRTVTMGKGIRKYSCFGFQRDEVGVCVHVMNISNVFDVLEYFKSEEVKIPVNTLKFHSDVCKEDVIVAGEMLNRKPEYAVIFAFAVDVQPEALQYADQLGVKIYSFDT